MDWLRRWWGDGEMKPVIDFANINLIIKLWLIFYQKLEEILFTFQCCAESDLQMCYTYPLIL